VPKDQWFEAPAEGGVDSKPESGGRASKHLSTLYHHPLFVGIQKNVRVYNDTLN